VLAWSALAIVRDKTARIDERNDAAMDLGTCDELDALTALMDADMVEQPRGLLISAAPA
jgi:hypothetical protein